MSLVVYWALTLALLQQGRPAACPDFEISAAVSTPRGSAKSERTEVFPATAPAGSRRVLEVAAGEEVVFRWTAKSRSESQTFADVLVHFVAVREEKLGQPEVPNLSAEDADVAHEGALQMDFKPGETASGKFTVRFDEPGPYLLRVETVDMARTDHGHDHFAAVEVLVR